MLDHENILEVRTFTSLEEIRSLEAFKGGNPINKNQYERIIGDYWLENKVKCCFEKQNGNLCNQEHNFGFVAELKDGSITIVGNCCAKDKFGADAQIKADRSKYLNEKRRLERLQAVRKLLVEKDTRLNVINEMRGKLQRVIVDLNNIKGKLGEPTQRKLVDMSRTGNGKVSLEIINLRQYTDDDGQIKTEKRVTPTTLGTIKGVSIFNKANFDSVYSAFNAVERTYNQVERIEEDVKSQELDYLTGQLGQFTTGIAQGENLVKAAVEFFKNDLTLLCFLVSDKPERYKAAHIAMEQEGISGGKDKAKQWLSQKEQELRKVLTADKLRILD